ncbi:receptor expression-enhancing protein 2-like isoform X1 [Rhopilema esculentum]|uniref:receptor expression-enhancing protein 2-like isoform X1 n=1 Tax=Rhopilema esculentum TaxID=499914 RepID=UPI0031E241B8
MISQLISRLMILSFGTLYPAYRSYKAVKTKDVREYVKWMMYWIVFAFFTAVENAADVFISWLPLYYEIKIIFLLWLLSPATKGSSILYRRFVHPWLARHEQDIDRYIDNAKQNGYVALLRVGRQGLNVATDTFLKTAVTGQTTLINTLRKYSSMQELNRNFDETDAPQNQTSRVTWYGKPSGPLDDNQYDFEDDYRILEEQYQHQYSGEYNTTLPGGAPLPRNPSFQTSIPEAADECDEETQAPHDPEADRAEEEQEEFVDSHPPPSAPPQHQNTANTKKGMKQGNVSAKTSKADEVSSMRGYSTLPRPRTQRSAPSSQPLYSSSNMYSSYSRPSYFTRSSHVYDLRHRSSMPELEARLKDDPLGKKILSARGETDA